MITSSGAPPPPNIPLPHTISFNGVVYCALSVYNAKVVRWPRRKCPALGLVLGPMTIFPSFLADTCLPPSHLKIPPHNVAGRPQGPVPAGSRSGLSFVTSGGRPRRQGVWPVAQSAARSVRRQEEEEPHFSSHHPRGRRSTTHTWGHLCPRLPSKRPRMSSWNQTRNT